MRRIVVAGTGRSGTTLLMQILTEMGYDTGFNDMHHDWRGTVRAGMEMGHPLVSHFNKDFKLEVETNKEEIRCRIDAMPRIIKSPAYSVELDYLLENDLIDVESVIIPMRDITQVAKSRIDTNLQSATKPLDGFMKDSSDLDRTEAMLYFHLGHLFRTLYKHRLDYVVIDFLEMVDSMYYMYGRLVKVFPDMEYGKFKKAWEKVVNKEMIKIK